MDKVAWWTPQVGEREYQLVREVLDSNYLNDGKVTRTFEARLGELLQVKHVVAVTSGTAAIYLALKALSIGPGDEVVVPDLTFIATANAVSMTGARAVLVDIDPVTLNMDPEAMERALTPRTKAVVPVHVSGRAANLDEILAIARAKGLPIVEDAAEAFLSRSGGKCLGSIGAMGCLSFSPNKTITTGQGGAVLTDDDALHVRLRELKDQGRPVTGTGGADVHATLGYNFKLTNVQAAIGLGQLDYVPARIQRMKQIYSRYAEALRDLDGIRLPGFSGEERPQWTDAVVARRDALDEYLCARNVDCRRFWYPIHTQAPYRERDERFPNCSRVAPQAIWLPSSFTLTDEEIDLVCTHIRTFLCQP